MAAASELRHELFAVLPLVQSANFFNLASRFVFFDMEECRGVTDLPKPRHFILLLNLEEGKILAIAMLFHFVSESCEYDGCSLTAWAEITKNLQNALIK